MLSNRHVRVALALVEQELMRRRRNGIPIPRQLVDAHRALVAELSPERHDVDEYDHAPAALETTQQRAHRLGVSKRTVERHAKAAGIEKINGSYLFNRSDS